MWIHVVFVIDIVMENMLKFLDESYHKISYSDICQLVIHIYCSQNVTLLQFKILSVLKRIDRFVEYEDGYRSAQRSDGETWVPLTDV